MSASPTLVIMAKNPEAGTVKTRLAPLLGAEGACRLYRAMLEDVVHTMAPGPWKTVVAVTPEARVGSLDADIPDEIEQVPQIGPDLPARMIGIFADLLGTSGMVVMRNSDSPDLPAERIEQAFRLLDDYDAVFGPDLGGGYYLVGLKRPCADLFRVTMSTTSNLDDTLERAAALDLKTALLPPHDDLDTPQELERFRDSSSSSLARRTRNVLDELLT